MLRVGRKLALPVYLMSLEAKGFAEARRMGQLELFSTAKLASPNGHPYFRGKIWQQENSQKETV